MMSATQMSRRQLLASAAAASAAAFLRLPAGAQASQQPSGNRFLIESAALAGSSIANRLDRELSFEPYFHLNIASDPPEAIHSSWDYADTAGRYVSAFIRLRALGLPVDDASEAGLRAFLLQNQEEGLFFDQASPWSEYLAETFAQSRAMFGLVDWFLATGEAAIETSIHDLISALEGIVEPSATGVVFPGRHYRPGGWLDRTLTSESSEDRIAKPGYGALVAEPLLRYAEASGDRRARRFAASLVSGFIETGSLTCAGHYIGHTHSWGMLPMALSIVRLALLEGRDDYLALAGRMFDFTVAKGTRWGWVPDGIGFAAGYVGSRYCETCGLADLAILGTELGRLGHQGAWDYVERLVKNQLVENQFRDTSPVIGNDSAVRSRTNAADILRGSFDAWARPNSLLGGLELLSHGGLEACCTGSAVVAIQQVLASTVTRRDGAVFVNLPLSVNSRLADVVSYEPEIGRLDVTFHSGGSLRVRLSEGVVPASIIVTIDGTPAAPVLNRQALTFDGLRPGARVSLTYSLREFSESVQVAGNDLTAQWRGTSVMSLDPSGEPYPIFRRNQPKSATSPLTPRFDFGPISASP